MADELVVCVDSPRPNGAGGGDIWCGTRPSRTSAFVMSNAGSLAPFGPATLVPVVSSAADEPDKLNTPSGEWPHWLSPDRCRLYFGSNRPGGAGAGSSIWVAERSP